MSEDSGKVADAAWTEKIKREGLAIDVKEDGAMRDLGGSRFGVFNHALMNETVRTAFVVFESGDKEAADRQVAGMVASAMRAFEPRDEIEGMLAAQATAMHLASMECFRRAVQREQSADAASKLRRDGTNMARGMTDMLTALARHRGKGQKVVVEHVHVHAGGQAVVAGAVTTGTPLSASPPPPAAIGQGVLPIAMLDAEPVAAGVGEGEHDGG